MSSNLKILQVFVASPNDLADERLAIKEIVDGLNLAFSKEVGIQIQLLGWEDCLPGYGRPQSHINEDVDKADLFIGFLWRRWGSDPGNPQYTSGFEEEFNRALERRERAGSPEISLFFKGIDEQSLRDPGDQLKRVLEFKQTIEKSKKILFRNFTCLADWKEQTRDLLQRHLLKLLANTMASRSQSQPQGPPTSTADESARSATSSKCETSASTANQQVIRLWGEAFEAIKKGGLTEFDELKSLDKLKIARLGLVAASMENHNIEAHMPGVHSLNLLYKNRKQFVLTTLERILVLRANLGSQSDNQPGWFWLRKTKLRLKAALVYLACRDEDALIRRAAISYTKKLGLPLRNRFRDKSQPIEILCSHEDEHTRKAALEYLAVHGTSKDLPLVDKLRSDPDNDVRSHAELTRNAIQLRDNASAFFQNTILTSAWISDACLSVVQNHLVKIRDELLR